MSKHAFTQIPNHYLDLLYTDAITVNQFKLISYIARWSKGCKASTSYFCKAVNMSNKTVISNIDYLLQANLIVRFELGNSFIYHLVNSDVNSSEAKTKPSSKKAEKKSTWCHDTWERLQEEGDVTKLQAYIRDNAARDEV